MRLSKISADPSGVERVGKNENANYPIPTTKYQCQLPDTQYPNILMPNTENIKMPKYPMFQNIRRPILASSVLERMKMPTTR